MAYQANGSFAINLTPLSFEGDPESGEVQLGRMSIDKTFSGDLVGRSVGQMLSARTSFDGSAGYVALELVEATLDGKQGSFVLQHSGTMNRGESGLSVTVVPDSGTGGLAGISGKMDIINTEDGHTYHFEYQFS